MLWVGQVQPRSNIVVMSPDETAQLRALLLQCGLDFIVVGKDAGFELGVNFCPVDNDLEPAVGIGDKGQSLNLLFVVRQ